MEVHFAREMPSADEILSLAAQVYEGLSPEDVDEIERLALDRSHFFVRREWALLRLASGQLARVVLAPAPLTTLVGARQTKGRKEMPSFRLAAF